VPNRIEIVAKLPIDHRDVEMALRPKGSPLQRGLIVRNDRFEVLLPNRFFRQNVLSQGFVGQLRLDAEIAL